MVEIVVPGSVIQAIEGIHIGPDGMIYGRSIHARAVYRIDPESGFVTVAVPPLYGESDDVAGDAIIADAESGRLLRLSGGEFEDLATGLHEPVALVLENDASVLVSEIGAGTVYWRSIAGIACLATGPVVADGAYRLHSPGGA
jgi:hypothetical protein